MPEPPDPGRPGSRRLRFLAWLKELPHATDAAQDRVEARVGLGIGLFLAAVGGLLFLLGWGRKVPWLLDSAFVTTLVGWMAPPIAGAFWLVLSLAARRRRKGPRP